MPLEWVCIGDTYADALHMDMLNISFLLSFSPKIRKKVNPEIIGYMVLSLEHGEHFSNRAREITHTICYANGHTNQPFFGVIHAVSTNDA